MSDAQSQHSIDKLLEQLAIDELDDAQQRALVEQIARNDVALHGYLETVYLRQGLAYIIGRGADSSRQSSSPSPATSPALIPNAGGRVPRRFGAWFVAAAAAFVAGAGVTAIALREWNRADRAQFAEVAPEIAPAGSARPLPLEQQGQLGKVTGLSLEASADGLTRSLQVGQELRCGEVVQFTQGFMRVELHSGTQLIIEGPAEFSLVANDAVFVRYGRVAAHGAGTLLLQSPLLMAECKDAEVAFEVAEDATTNVYAYRGIVTMRDNARPGEMSAKLGVLHASEGTRFVSDGDRRSLEQHPIGAPQNLVRSWRDVETELTPYESLVLSDRPLAYWPLYHVRRNRRVLDLTQHGYDGQAIGKWPLELDPTLATDERGAHFNGESYIEPDRKPPVDPRRGFSVEAWAKVEGGPAYQSIFTSRWVLDTFTPQRQCLGYTLYAGDNDRWQLWTGNGKYGILWNELHTTDVPVARGQWVHLVATFDPLPATGGNQQESVIGAARLYVDGKLAAQSEHEMSLVDFEWPARIGAAEFVPNSLTAWLFRGHLRDIAVYDYVLEAEHVSAHYEVGQRRVDAIGRAAMHMILSRLTHS